MKSLFWLLLTRGKNRLKTFFRKPTNWIATVFIVALLVMLVISGMHTDLTDLRPRAELNGMVFLLLSVVYAFSAYQGLGRGASLYSMADVQLLFPSPLTPRNILFYGLIQQVSSSILVGFYLLFQYGWLSQNYAITFAELLLVFLLDGVAMFMGQLTAMVIYSGISGRESRKKHVTMLFFAIIIAFAAYGFVQAQGSGKHGLNALLTLVDDPMMMLFPVGGWLYAAFIGIEAAQLSTVLLGIGSVILFAAVLVWRIGSTSGEYYEDVLAATAKSHQAITAKKEGRAMEALPENVKLGKTGLGGGWGASTIFYKHRLEARRGKRFLLDTTSLVFLVISLVMSFFLRETGFLVVFIFLTYMQLFSTTTGRWVRELQLPWIYRLPDSTFRRLLACLGESTIAYLLEAVLMMVPVGLMCGESLSVILMAIVARFLLSLLFVGGNLLTDRLFPNVQVKMLQILLYVVIMLVLLVPSILLCMWMVTRGMILISLSFTVMLWLSMPVLLIAPLAIFLSRGVLNNVELHD